MSADLVVTLVAGIVSILMVASKFIDATKPLWAKLPKPLSIVLPALAALLPQVSDLVGASTTAISFVQNLIAAGTLLIVGLLAKPHVTTPPSV